MADSEDFEKLLWSTSTEEEYLRQMVGYLRGKTDLDEANKSALSAAIQAMDNAKVDESANASVVKERHRNSSLEKMIRKSRMKERTESVDSYSYSNVDNYSYSRSDAYSRSGRSDDYTSRSDASTYSGSNCHYQRYLQEMNNVSADNDNNMDDNNTDDNNTVDKMIEETEREEEINRNEILTQIVNDFESAPPMKQKPSTKDIIESVVSTYEDRQGSKKKKTLVETMNNSSHHQQIENDSLAGFETVDKIVTNIMDGASSDDGMARSWTDFQPIARSVATETTPESMLEPMSEPMPETMPGTNKFVMEDTSVGSISDEIELIVEKHNQEQFDDEMSEIQNTEPGYDASVERTDPGTMVSSLTFDATHYARTRSKLGAMPADEKVSPTPNTTDNHEKDVEKGTGEEWWMNNQSPPRSPRHNRMRKEKEPPGTPATIVIVNRSFSDSSSMNPDQNRLDDNDDDDKMETPPTFFEWIRLRCGIPKRHGKLFLCLVIGSVITLIVSIILIIAAAANLGKSMDDSNQSPTALLDDPGGSLPSANDIPKVSSTVPPIATGSPTKSPVTLPTFFPTETPIDLPQNVPTRSPVVAPTKSPTKAPVQLSTSSPTESGLSTSSPTESGLSTSSPTASPIDVSPIDPSQNVIVETLREVLFDSLPESLEAWQDPLSPQARAVRWLISNTPNTSVLNFSPVVEKYVLAVFYFSTNGNDWDDNTGWLTESDICEWFSTSTGGSICDSLGRIDEINLRSNNLTGQIPSELVLLKDQMIKIQLNGNSLEGTFPSVIGEMTNLERFHIHWNSVAGTLPTTLGQLQELKSFRLGQNDVVGTIPSGFGLMSNLEGLDLGGNGFTGNFPSFILTLTTLTELDLANNDLSGPIPFQLSALSSLVRLELDRNSFTGRMPREVCRSFQFLEIAKVDCQEVQCSCCEGCNV